MHVFVSMNHHAIIEQPDVLGKSVIQALKKYNYTCERDNQKW